MRSVCEARLAVLILVLGGIRSGKSSHARSLAERSGRTVTYLATGLAGDEEMHRRIEAHRKSRPRGWAAVEEPLQIGRAIDHPVDVVLLESLDGWLGNLFANGTRDGGDDAAAFDAEALVARCVEELAELTERAGQLIVVSSEIGLAPVPLTPLGRAFADALGLLNQRIAAISDEVHLVVAGLSLRLDTGGAARGAAP
jgi:adenosylcobinamide kinase/adenosylcobinamide-phosphate guanylyltransferase